MGNVMTVPGVISTPSGKLLYNDPIMSRGSLFLFDPTHSLGEFSGVPANADVLPNIAWDTAAEILGSGDATSLGAVAFKSEGTPGAYLHERSGLGGLHGLYSEVTTGGAGERNYFGVRTPIVLSQYLYSHRANDLFFSAWMRVTRKIGTTSASPQAPFYYAQSTAAYLFHSQSGYGINPTIASGNGLGARGGVNIQSAAAGTPTIINVGTTALTGTDPGSWPGSHAVAAAGAHGAWEGANKLHPLGAIIERVYIEDLTVSGRTYAEVDAIDLALHTQAHAAGGRWYGDTYTNPGSFL